MGHHRFIKVNMVVWLVDPTPEPGTSGPPDDQVAADLVEKMKPLRAKGHKVGKSTVTSTESTTTPPPP